MNRLSRLAAACVAGLIAFIPLAASADAWDVLAANREAAWSAEYGVPDFTLTKSEFGNTTLGAVIHLGLESVAESVVGFNVVYHAATDEVLIWATTNVKDGDDFNPGVIRNVRCERLAESDPDNPMLRDNGFCDWATNNATQAPGSTGGPYVAGVIAATDRECTFELDKPNAHKHTC